VIDLRQQQRSFGEGFIQETVDELWEDWMRQADALLEDEALLGTIYEALEKRRPHSRTHGRPGTPAEVVLRMGWKPDLLPHWESDPEELANQGMGVVQKANPKCIANVTAFVAGAPAGRLKRTGKSASTK
jgi:hypothetical protein